jgi:phospholipid/cholesterol/gamma-HCH transport system ATP-binding protein
LIQIFDLYKSFGEKRVLEGLELRVKRGETLVVLGPSGCGKTVLLKLIIGLLKPERGRILVDGTNLATLNRKGLYLLRRRFGMVFQGAALFDSMTVRENVGLGLRERGGLSRKEIEEEVDKTLELVGMGEMGALWPAELSGGMKKRVGLARAIAMNPEIMLYDEPTTGLDPQMAEAINGLILSLKKRFAITSMAVTHDIGSARKIADRIALLHEGRIGFEGSPREVELAENKLVQEFLRGKDLR